MRSQSLTPWLTALPEKLPLLATPHLSEKSVFYTTVGSFALLIGIITGWLTYSLRSEQFLYDMTREAETLLLLTSSYVSTYSDVSKEHAGKDSPVPAEFRALASNRFNEEYTGQQSLKLNMVGVADHYIKTPPTDNALSEHLSAMVRSNSFDQFSELAVINESRILRSVFPSVAKKEGCVDCHNRLQPDKPIWKIGDLMGAYVIDRGVEKPLARIFRQACVAALMAALTILLTFIIVRQNCKLRSSSANLQKLANTDSLTGCLNRRALLSASTDAMKNNGAAGGLFVLDIDHFKRINDTYGHQIGDSILIHFSDLVRQQLRDSDIFARIGGEEFVVYLPGADKSESEAIARRLCKVISDHAYEEEGQVIHYTVSIGVVQMIESRYCTFMTWLNAADQLLYEAKEAGRNRVSLRA